MRSRIRRPGCLHEPLVVIEVVETRRGLLNGLSPAMEFDTLVHEHAHELLHRADDRPVSRATRELEAEAVAFVVGGAVGLDTSDASRDYILLYRGDREALSGSLDRIQRAASLILKVVSVGG